MASPDPKMPPPDVMLRLATREDLPELTRIANAANATSSLQGRLAPRRETNPTSYFHWRHLVLRHRFTRPDMRFVVAIDSTTCEILGFSIWAAEGSSHLLDTFKKQRGWDLENTIERRLVEVEQKYNRYVTDRSIDWAWLDTFHAEAQKQNSRRPSCLHLWLLEVDPRIQYRGVGRRMMEWGLALAEKEKLPMVLESHVEAVGFYERCKGTRLRDMVMFASKDEQECRTPLFVWEGKGNEGTWLERDGEYEGKEIWRWKT